MKPVTTLLICLILTISPLIWAQEIDEPTDAPGLVLLAPDTCDIGQLVRLDARESRVDTITWAIIPETDDFEVVDGGRRAFFSSRVGGEFLIILAGANGGVPFLMYQKLTVTGSDRKAVNNPALTKMVSKWVDMIPEYKGREAHVAAIAAVFRQPTEGVDIDSILDATARAATAIVGKDKSKWIPFMERLGNELDRMSDAGELNTREQYVVAWVQIARGIEKGL